MRPIHPPTRPVTLTTTPGLRARLAGTAARAAAALRELRRRITTRRPVNTHLAIDQLDAATLRDLGLDFSATAVARWQ